MSVIFAVLSKTCGVVASDSICFPSAGGVTFDSDKTFRLSNYPIIGAYCGLLEFSGLHIPEHVDEILKGKSFGNMRQLVDAIQREICLRVSKSGYCDSKIEILLVGRDLISGGHLTIGTIEIFHKYNGTPIHTTKIFKKAGAYAHSGDDTARSEIVKQIVPNIKIIKSMNKASLKVAIKQAMESGIANCGKSPIDPSQRACGGEVNLLTVW